MDANEPVTAANGATLTAAEWITSTNGVAAEASTRAGEARDIGHATYAEVQAMRSLLVQIAASITDGETDEDRLQTALATASRLGAQTGAEKGAREAVFRDMAPVLRDVWSEVMADVDEETATDLGLPDRLERIVATVAHRLIPPPA